MSVDAAPEIGRRLLAFNHASDARHLALVDRSRVAVLGGGPAGSLFGYFLRRLADSVGLELHVDVYEPRFFSHAGPAGCNHCGGVVSESLVQLLALEGINLPPHVVQRGIESYMLHTDVGDVRIETPTGEKRIASVFRGAGPRDCDARDVDGLDGFLLELSRAAGAKILRTLVTGVQAHGDGIEILTSDGTGGSYALVAVASGVNSQLARTIANATPAHEPPRALRTFICEFDLGEETVRQCLGDSMHVFLLDLAGLEFAALVPKGRFATLCLLGDVGERLVERFLSAPEVACCFPGSVVPRPVCQCFPRINVGPAGRPFADRMVWIGDCAVARLYKDGIGSAYRTAKAAARTAVFHGIAARDFERHFWPECRALDRDNRIGKAIFAAAVLPRRLRFVRRAIVRMVAAEQAGARPDKPMSSTLWDTFTGSAPYREIALRLLHPNVAPGLAANLVAANLYSRGTDRVFERRRTSSPKGARHS